MFARNLAAVKDQLVGQHKFGLTSDDLRTIEYVYTAFFAAGPDLTYSFTMPGRGSSMMFYGRRMPTYGELMMESDGAGVQRSYLATEENFRVLRDLERNNLIVPLVGRFCRRQGDSVGGPYVKEHGATVTAFYTSNVEQYLFQSDDWRKFFANVGTLPVDSASTFIRAVFNFANTMPSQSGTPGPRSRTMLAPIIDQVKAFSDGRMTSYWDVVQTSR